MNLWGTGQPGSETTSRWPRLLHRALAQLTAPGGEGFLDQVCSTGHRAPWGAVFMSSRGQLTKYGSVNLGGVDCRGTSGPLLRPARG
jgi:hypothetical protein